MTVYYVDSAGSNTAPYDTWAKAANLLTTIAGIDAAGDTIYVKSTHNGANGAAAVTNAWAGTAASPTRIICVSDSGEPPTTVATGAIESCTGANNYTVASTGYVYMYGIKFVAGDSTNAADIIFTNSTGHQVYEQCTFELAGNSSGSDIVSGTNSSVVWDTCTFKTINSGSRIQPNISRFTMRGCSAASGTLANSLFDSSSSMVVLVEGCNFENMPSNFDMFSVTGIGNEVTIRNCKMPATWTTGSVFTGTVGSGSKYAMYNCAAGDTQYALEVKTEFGTVTHDTSIYRNSGASNGITTGISWKMVSGANAEWAHQTLDSPEIVIWNTAVGSAKTVTVEFIIDSAVTLYKEDVWMEVQYLGTSGVPLSVFDNDSRLATYLTAQATTVCDSGTGLANWTGDGGTGNSYKLVSTITPQEVGFIHVVVKLAKASTTIYVDPKITIA